MAFMRPPNWLMYVVWRVHSCLRLLAHEVTLARRIALVMAGRRRAARIPMMTITTSSSTRVNPLRFLDIGLPRSEEHTSELQSHSDLVCRLLLEKKKKQKN